MFSLGCSVLLLLLLLTLSHWTVLLNRGSLLCFYCIFITFILFRFMPPSRPTAATVDEEVTPRPIIKEEDLSKMDDIAHDAGWATHDDIDYK